MRQATRRSPPVPLAALCALASLAGGCFGPSHGDASPDGRVRVLRHVAVAGHASEIVKYSKAARVVLSTDGEGPAIDLVAVRSWEGSEIEVLDCDPARRGVQGVAMPGEPVGCAAHPTLPIGLAVCRPEGGARPGRLVAFDLRGEAPRRILIEQGTGPGPDSVAVTPDGRWAVIAIEAEGDATVPGGIEVVDLTSLSFETAAALPSISLAGLGAALRVPDGVAEPEFVACDPRSRFAAVSCQEQDAVVLVDLHGSAPRIAGTIFLGDGASPDGVAVLDDVAGPDGRRGALVAVAEEGRRRRGGSRSGNAASLWWVDPDRLERDAVLLSRTDLRSVVHPGERAESGSRARLDPEGIDLARVGDKVVAVVAVERGDLLCALDVTDPARPVALGVVKVADLPEGVVAISDGRRVVAVAGCEGHEGPAILSFVEVIP